jgi:hypothetical protein
MSQTDSIVIGFVLIAIGGNGPYITNMTLGALLTPGMAPLYVGLNVALFNLAGFVLIAMPSFGFTRRPFFLGYAIAAAVAMLAAAVIYPLRAPMRGDRYAPPGWPSVSLSRCLPRRGARGGGGGGRGGGDDDRKQRSASLLADMPGDAGASRFGGASGAAAPSPPGFLAELRRPWLWLITVFYSVILFIVAFLGGALPDLANQRAVAEGRVDSGIYNSLLNPVIGNGVPVVLSPIIGLLIPRLGFVRVFAATQFFCVLTLGLAFARPLWMQALVLVAYGALKAFTIGPTFEFIGAAFPPRLYGSFVAFVTGAAALLGLLSIPLVDAVDRRYNAIFYIFIALVPPLAVFPGMIAARGMPAPPPEEPCLEEFRVLGAGLPGHDSDDDDNDGGGGGGGGGGGRGVQDLTFFH